MYRIFGDIPNCLNQKDDNLSWFTLLNIVLVQQLTGNTTVQVFLVALLQICLLSLLLLTIALVVFANN
jgi:hypothetical protein